MEPEVQTQNHPGDSQQDYLFIMNNKLGPWRTDSFQFTLLEFIFLQKKVLNRNPFCEPKPLLA